MLKYREGKRKSLNHALENGDKSRKLYAVPNKETKPEFHY